MENLLKRQLAQIKARALRLRNRAPDADSAADVGEQVIDDVVKTGAVVRGSDFVPRPRTPPQRWSWRRRGQDDVADVLARYRTGEPLPIERVAPGAVRTPNGHAVYVVRASGGDVDPAAPVEAARFTRLARWPESVASMPDFSPERVLFLDIETTGLSPNTYVFLCGLMYAEGGEFVVEQVFARDYGEEEGLLHYVRDTMARFDSVVTYNGASFDLPFIRTRMAVHRVSVAAMPVSVDLLYATRRVFRDILPNRRLTTVERHLRRVEREDDIPGRYIPDAYHEFVRSGDARVMKHVLYHNRMDLFTMAVIVTALSGGAMEPGGPGGVSGV